MFWKVFGRRVWSTRVKIHEFRHQAHSELRRWVQILMVKIQTFRRQAHSEFWQQARSKCNNNNKSHYSYHGTYQKSRHQNWFSHKQPVFLVILFILTSRRTTKRDQLVATMTWKTTTNSKRAITSEEILRSDCGVVEGNDDVEGDCKCDDDV